PVAPLPRGPRSRVVDGALVAVFPVRRPLSPNGEPGPGHRPRHAMILVGGGVRGGRVHGRWPGLSRERLYEQRDLAVTTDFRDVFGEVLAARMGLSPAALDRVFPGYARKGVP